MILKFRQIHGEASRFHTANVMRMNDLPESFGLEDEPVMKLWRMIDDTFKRSRRSYNVWLMVTMEPIENPKQPHGRFGLHTNVKIPCVSIKLRWTSGRMATQSFRSDLSFCDVWRCRPSPSKARQYLWRFADRGDTSRRVSLTVWSAIITSAQRVSTI